MLSIKRPRLLQVFLYLSLVSSTSFIVRPHFASSQNEWLVWSALILSLALLPYRRCKIISLLSMAFIIFILPAAFFASSFLLMLIYLLVITTLMVFLGEAYKKYYLLLFVINLFSILSASLALAGDAANGKRLFFVVIGISIALIWQMIFLPKFTSRELQYETQLALAQLKRLVTEIFSCFLQPEYPENIYLFERRLHQQKEKFFRSMNNIYKLARFDTAQEKTSKLIIFELSQVFDVLLSIAQLRRRVSDYTIFSVCKPDMLALSKTIENQFTALIEGHNSKLQPERTDGLMQTIRQFEATYQSVLQVTAQEPLVFLLFIYDLKNLSRLMEEFNHETYFSLKASKK